MLKKTWRKGIVTIYFYLLREKDDICYENFIGTEAAEPLNIYSEVNGEEPKIFA